MNFHIRWTKMWPGLGLGVAFGWDRDERGIYLGLGPGSLFIGWSDR